MQTTKELCTLEGVLLPGFLNVEFVGALFFTLLYLSRSSTDLVGIASIKITGTATNKEPYTKYFSNSVMSRWRSSRVIVPLRNVM